MNLLPPFIDAIEFNKLAGSSKPLNTIEYQEGLLTAFEPGLLLLAPEFDRLHLVECSTGILQGQIEHTGEVLPPIIIALFRIDGTKVYRLLVDGLDNHSGWAISVRRKKRINLFHSDGSSIIGFIWLDNMFSALYKQMDRLDKRVFVQLPDSDPGDRLESLSKKLPPPEIMWPRLQANKNDHNDRLDDNRNN